MNRTNFLLITSCFAASSPLLGCSSDATDAGRAGLGPTPNVDDSSRIAARVEQAARLTLGRDEGALERVSRLRTETLAASGYRIHSGKFLHPRTREVIGVTTDEEGRTLDREAVIAQDRSIYRARHGAFSADLAERVERAAPDSGERIPVMVWLDEEALGLPAVPERKVWDTPAEMEAWVEESERILALRRNLIGTKAREVLAGVDDLEVHAPLPVAMGLASPSRLRELKSDARLSSIEEVREGGAMESDLADAANFMRVSGPNSLHGSGFKGSGVKAGIWHYGYPNFVSQMGSPSYRTTSATPNGDQHLAYMIASVRNGRTVPSRGTGFAPGATIKVANFNYSSDWPTFINNSIGAYNWARDTAGVPVLNQSWHVSYNGNFKGYPSNEETGGNQDYLDRMLDYGAATFPYVLPVQASGNITVTDEFVNHKGWNNLVVGQDWQLDQMVSTSCWRNGDDGHELPHVTSGVDDTMSMFENPDGTPVVTANGATSVAAAVMTGFAASVIGVDPILAHYPEVLRAIIMASAKNVVGAEMNDDWLVDQQDGAGRPDGAFARDIALHRTTGTSGLGAAGYQIGSFNGSSQIRALSFTTPGGRLKVAISWFARVSGTNYVNTSLSDLDVRVFDSNDNLVGFSLQSGEPAELVGLNVPAGTYTIRVYGYAVPYTTVYGVAWVTG